MNKMTLDYTEKNHILEVNGVEYEVPQRTPDIVDKIKARDEKVGEVSEYESNMELLIILFGKKNAKQMFPDKENTNLDKLAKCVKYATALFYADLTAIQNENLRKALDELNPALKALDKVSKAANTAEMKKFVSTKKK